MTANSIVIIFLTMVAVCTKFQKTTQSSFLHPHFAISKCTYIPQKQCKHRQQLCHALLTYPCHKSLPLWHHVAIHHMIQFQHCFWSLQWFDSSFTWWHRSLPWFIWSFTWCYPYPGCQTAAMATASASSIGGGTSSKKSAVLVAATAK